MPNWKLFALFTYPKFLLIWPFLILGDRYDGCQLEQLDCDGEACQPAKHDGAAQRIFLKVPNFT